MLTPTIPYWTATSMWIALGMMASKGALSAYHSSEPYWPSLLSRMASHNHVNHESHSPLTRASYRRAYLTILRSSAGLECTAKSMAQVIGPSFAGARPGIPPTGHLQAAGPAGAPRPKPDPSFEPTIVGHQADPAKHPSA